MATGQLGPATTTPSIPGAPARPGVDDCDAGSGGSVACVANVEVATLTGTITTTGAVATPVAGATPGVAATSVAGTVAPTIEAGAVDGGGVVRPVAVEVGSVASGVAMVMVEEAVSAAFELRTLDDPQPPTTTDIEPTRTPITTWRLVLTYEPNDIDLLLRNRLPSLVRGVAHGARCRHQACNLIPSRSRVSSGPHD